MRLAMIPVALWLGLIATGAALGQEGAGNAVPKGSTPAAKQGAPQAAPGDKPPAASVAGSFGSWTLLCGKEDEGDGKERCSLVLPLVEKESQKLIFRVIVTYGPQGNLVLRVDGPTGVALQRGVEFSPDAKKIYRMAFQTCLPMGCKALLLMSDDLKKELAASKQGAITIYALNGQPVQTLASLAGFAEGLAALEKHRGASK